MPLFNHSVGPLSGRLPYQTLLHALSVAVADDLCRQLPEPFLADQLIHSTGRPFIDVHDSPADDGPAAIAGAALNWQPPLPEANLPFRFPECFEVNVFQRSERAQPSAAVLFVGPGNKDSAAERRAFASKVVSYLHDGVALTLIDLVGTPGANLHNEVMALSGLRSVAPVVDTSALYAASYRPMLRDSKAFLKVWTAPFKVGDRLPTMPLRVVANVMVPIDFERIYMQVCRARRMI